MLFDFAQDFEVEITQPFQNSCNPSKVTRPTLVLPPNVMCNNIDISIPQKNVFLEKLHA